MALMMRGDYQGTAPEISRANPENLKHGFYVLSEEEKSVLRGNNGNLEFIWDKSGNHNLNSITEGRPYAGLKQTAWDSVREHDRIFIPSTLALNNIKIDIGDHIISDIAQYKLRMVVVFAKFLGANIEKAVISTTLRSAEKQAEIMISDYFNDPNNTFYPNSRALYLEELKRDTFRPMVIREKAAKEKLIAYIKKNFMSFPHVEENAGNNEVFDVAPNISKITGRNADLLNLSMEMFKANGFISSKSLPYTLSGDKAFHFVIAR